MPELKNKFACLKNLPSMPVLLMEALQQISGKQNLTTLVDKIGEDPSMVVRILRIANSPFYGMSREIGSLREAIVLLGINRIKDMLISLCFSKMLPAQHKDFNFDLFRHHSMAVAECTRQLANCTHTSSDFAFTAGLLHDIGNLVIVILFPDEFSRLVKISAKFGIEEEQNILGFNHTTIGGKAAQYWNFPQEIQEAIEQHETYPESATSKSLGLLVYTANLLIVNTEQPDKSALEEHQPICTALATLNVSIDQAAHCTDSGRQFADQILTLY
ncbi:MAG: HDOD domain-containing protein [Methylobacter sp.]|uniref:HDOD domain-containing protein n=1 Tax=Methylobacter sp. TaxID=2051955 RepID=UPI00273201F5|nr:HDOD domain-containing protein [Methylobacter sp.]MDP1666786.1 HDOD domain-containing protein [Methylobacter sp.]